MPSVQKKQQLLSVLESLPEESQEKVLDFAEALARGEEKESSSAEKPLMELEGFLKDKERGRQGVVSVEEMNRVVKQRGGELS